MRKIVTNKSFSGNEVAIFESTQVALNIDFLALVPSNVAISTFFIELAEELELTFCEQIDNHCPVLLGMWTNILKAEEKLQQFLLSWQQQKDTRELDTLVPVAKEQSLMTSSENEPSQISVQTSEQQLVIDLPEEGENATSCVYESPGSQLYMVTSDVASQMHCTLTTIGLQDCASETSNKQTKVIGVSDDNISETDSNLKEIYVDIAISPIKTAHMKKVCAIDFDQTDQHPLDKLCQLLCIDEDETIEKRLQQTEKNRKKEANRPYKFFCELCSFKAKRENHFVKHVKLHEKTKSILFCDQCEFRTIREGVLCRHKKEHSTTHVHCKLCSYKANTNTLLAKHMRTNHTPGVRKKSKCSFCDFTAITRRQLQKHVRLLHTTDTVKLWKCSQCPYKSKVRGHVTRHENDRHGTLRQFLCHYCGMRFKRNETLTQHKIVHGEIGKTFTCEHCGKVCTTAVILREHLATHTSERPFLCDECGRSFKSTGAVQRHKRVVHSSNATSLACSQCERVFKNKTELSRHRKTHRLKAEASIVPAVTTGASVQEGIISSPVAIQVIYTEQLVNSNQHVTTQRTK